MSEATRPPFKRGDIIRHTDGSIYVVEAVKERGRREKYFVMAVSTVVETVCQRPIEQLHRIDWQQCHKISEVAP